MFVSLKENLFRLRLGDIHIFLQNHEILIKEIWINKKTITLHPFEIKVKGIFFSPQHLL